MDKRPYVSLSRDRSSGTEDPTPTSSTDSKVNEEELSLFALNMPGVLTLEETKALKLENWYLLYHGSFVQMSVSTRSISTVLLSLPQRFLTSLGPCRLGGHAYERPTIVERDHIRTGGSFGPVNCEKQRSGPI